jgi:hypothetical protein
VCKELCISIAFLSPANSLRSRSQRLLYPRLGTQRGAGTHKSFLLESHHHRSLWQSRHVGSESRRQSNSQTWAPESGHLRSAKSFNTTTSPSSLAYNTTLVFSMPSDYSINLSELCRHESWRVGCLSCKQHHTRRQCAEVTYRIGLRINHTRLTIYRPKQSLGRLESL